MTSIFTWLHDFLAKLVCWVQTAATDTFNAVVAAIAGAVAAAASVLPDMPAFPGLPDQVTTVLGWVAWVFPVHQAVLAFAFIVGAWVLWQVVAMAMRWARLLA
jgi:hypothetical protein